MRNICLVWKLLGAQKWKVVLSCFFRAICLGLCALSISLLTKEVVNEVADGLSFHWRAHSAVYLYATLFLFVGYGLSDCYLRSNVVSSGKRLRETIMGRALGQKYSATENNTPQFMVTLNQDVPQYLRIVEQNIPELLATVITTGIMVVVAFQMNILVATLSLLCSGVFGVSVLLIKKMQYVEECAREKNEELSKMLMEIHKGLPLFHLFIGTTKYLKRYILAIQQLYSIDKKKAWIAATLSLLAYASNILREFGVIFLAYLISSEDLGTTGALLNITSFVNGFVVSLVMGVAQMSGGVVAANHIITGINVPQDASDSATLHEGITSFECSNLAFHYEQNVGFKDVSLKAQTGQIVGILGNIGAGKTTLIKLFCGLVEPDKGSFFLNDTQTDSSAFLRQYSTLVDQECAIFPGTVLDNITMFSNQKRGDVTSLIERVGLSTWVSGLPQGIDTVLDPDLLSMSGGQRQRLVLARAIFRDTPILLFDEPTASLDNQGVYDFIGIIESLKTDRVIIMVTHDTRLMPFFDMTYHLRGEHNGEQ